MILYNLYTSKMVLIKWVAKSILQKLAVANQIYKKRFSNPGQIAKPNIYTINLYICILYTRSLSDNSNFSLT